jgi:hypothetical protein
MRGPEPKRHGGIWRAPEQYASSDAPLAESERIILILAQRKASDA